MINIKFQLKKLWFLPALALIFNMLLPVVGANTEIDRLEIIRAIVWNPAGTLYAVGGGPDVCASTSTDNYDVFIVDGSSNTIVQTLTGNECPVTSLAWNSDGTRLASSNYAARVIVWDTNGGVVAEFATGPAVSRAYSIDWHPTLTTSFAVVDDSGRGTIIDLSPSMNHQFVGNLDTDIAILEWEAVTGNLITGHESGLVHRWDINQNIPVTTLVQHTTRIMDIEINEQENLLAVASIGGELSILDLTTDSIRSTLQIPTTYFLSDIAWQPDGLAVAISVDNKIEIFNVASIQLTEHAISNNFLYSVAWSPDGSQISYGGENGEFQITMAQPEYSNIDK